MLVFAKIFGFKFRPIHSGIVSQNLPPGPRAAGDIDRRHMNFAQLLGRILCAALTAAALALPVRAADAVRLLLDLESRRAISAENAAQAVPAQATVALMTLYASMTLMREQGVEPAAVVELASAKVTEGTGRRAKTKTVPRSATVEELLRALLMSGDDEAARALTAKLSADEAAFTAVMNREAKRLGLTRTVFTTPFETPDAAQTTSAADLAVLAEALFRDHPEVRAWAKTRTAELAGRTVTNTNTLLERSNAVTGVFRSVGEQTADAVVLFENPRANGDVRRLMAVMLRAEDAEDLDETVFRMLGNGYRNHETVGVYGADALVARLPVLKGVAPDVAVGTDREVLITVERAPLLEAPNSRLRVEVIYEAPLTAPLRRGDRVGDIRVSFNGEEAARVPAVLLEDVPQGSFWARMADQMRLALGWYEKSNVTSPAERRTETNTEPEPSEDAETGAPEKGAEEAAEADLAEETASAGDDASPTEDAPGGNDKKE